MQHQISSTSSFKKFLTKIFLPFFLLSLVVGVVFNYFFEHKVILGSEISGAYKVNRIINENNPDEIAFLGSSRAEGTFIPDSLVKNGFNYGMSGAFDDVILFCLREECKKKNKTTPIIIAFDLDGLNYSIGDVSNYLYNSDYPLIKKLLDTNYKAVYRVPFLKYYGHFEMYTKYYLNSKSNLTKYTNKGASIEKNELKKEKFDELINKRLKEATTFHNDPTLLADFLELIKSSPNRKIIIVIPPYHSSFFNKFTNINEAEAFLSLLRSKENVAVLNFSRLVYPDNYFFNTSHLNLAGAIEFNHLLKDSLTQFIKK